MKQKRIFIIHGWEGSPKREWFPWIETAIDLDKVKKVTNKITVVFSDNDSFVPLEVNKKIFEEKLEAKIIIEQSKGHFDEDNGIFEIPVVLKILLDYIGE